MPSLAAIMVFGQVGHTNDDQQVPAAGLIHSQAEKSC